MIQPLEKAIGPICTARLYMRRCRNEREFPATVQNEGKTSSLVDLQQTLESVQLAKGCAARKAVRRARSLISPAGAQRRAIITARERDASVPGFFETTRYARPALPPAPDQGGALNVSAGAGGPPEKIPDERWAGSVSSCDRDVREPHSRPTPTPAPACVAGRHPYR